MDSPIYFAIGDVHGESGKLDDLHRAILERIAFEKRPARIVHLGDYVDRGRDSRGVVEQCMALEKQYKDSPLIHVISLIGNHEQMMLKAFDDPSDDHHWRSQGGAETLESYSIENGDDWRQAIPREHIAWMRSLPSMVYDSDRQLAFVHAGIDPATFPNCSDHVRMWTRTERFFDTTAWPKRVELEKLVVVHGHTPKSFEPEIGPQRINVDTGAVFGGPLTAVMLKEGAKPEFLRA